MEKIAVIGAGSWGTALAVSLASKGYEIRLWDRKPELVKMLNETRENTRYLADVMLPQNITAYNDDRAAIEDADTVVYVIPAQGFRGVFEKTHSYLKESAVVVNCAKGIEQKTLKRMSEIAYEVMPDVTYAVVSGPSHAEEVGRGMPTTLTVAAENIETAKRIQDIFMNDTLRIYTNEDIIGVELGGALKNIIALGAGISDGMGFGDNAKAAMMTRGITEIKRLGVRLGANPNTFNGLSGIGDLIVTCTSMHSRNRRCGILIGEGMDPQEATEKIGMVVEGMFTTEAAYELAKMNDVEMPITEQIYRIINGHQPAADAVGSLMKRKKKNEDEESDLRL